MNYNQITSLGILDSLLFAKDFRIVEDEMKEAFRYRPPTANDFGGVEEYDDEIIPDEFNLQTNGTHTYRARISSDGKEETREFEADSPEDAMSKVHSWLYQDQESPADIRHKRDVFFTHNLMDSPKKVLWIKNMTNNKLIYDKEGKHYQSN